MSGLRSFPSGGQGSNDPGRQFWAGIAPIIVASAFGGFIAVAGYDYFRGDSSKLTCACPALGVPDLPKPEPPKPFVVLCPYCHNRYTVIPPRAGEIGETRKEPAVKAAPKK